MCWRASGLLKRRRRAAGLPMIAHRSRSGEDTLVLLAAWDRVPLILTATDATPLERLAADELRTYLHRITGRRPALRTEADADVASAPSAVLVASAGSSPAARRAADAAGLIPGGDAGLEGFLLRTPRVGEQQPLMVVGETPTSTLHAVYHLLESVLHCGFFEGGEQVPARTELAIGDLDVVERPQFALRGFSAGCVHLYSTPYWSLDEWRREIDWLARKKFNMLYFFTPWVRGRAGATDPVARRVWREFGLEEQGDPDFEDEAGRLCRAVLAQARSRGLRILTPTFGGAVPSEFRARHPECRYLEMRWERTSPEVHLDPRDPVFAHVSEAFVRAYAEIFGSDHLYVMPLYGEMNPAATREESQRVRVACARAWTEGMRAADPAGVAQLDSWSFRGHPDLSPDEVLEVLEAIPAGAVFISDTWADANPLYQKLRQFFDRPWAFSVLHSMAGNSGLHGDAAGLVAHVQEVIRAPETQNCRHFAIEPEVIGHNPLFYDLVAHLAWAPASVDIRSFGYDYAVRRWGESSLPRTVGLVQELLLSVYGREDWTGPQYQQGPGVTRDTRLQSRLPFRERLRTALAVALEEAGRGAPRELLLQDILEIGQQYLGEVYNAHWLRLQAAFEDNDAGAVRREGDALCAVLQAQTDLLGTHPEWTLGAEVRRGLRTGASPSDAARRVKARYSYLGIEYGVGWDQYPFLLDYARRNRAELVMHYYLPRLRAYLEALDHRLQDATGKPFPADHPGSGGLASAYRRIVEAFVEGPVPLSEITEVDPAAVIAAARRAIADPNF